MKRSCHRWRPPASIQGGPPPTAQGAVGRELQQGSFRAVELHRRGVLFRPCQQDSCGEGVPQLRSLSPPRGHPSQIDMRNKGRSGYSLQHSRGVTRSGMRLGIPLLLDVQDAVLQPLLRSRNLT